MASTSNMFLYSLSILPPSAITQAVLGAFSGKKQQEIVVAQGSRLTLLRPDASQAKVQTVLSHDVFGIIRSLASFRLAGSSKGTLCLLTLFGNLNPSFFLLHCSDCGFSFKEQIERGLSKWWESFETLTLRNCRLHYRWIGLWSNNNSRVQPHLEQIQPGAP